MQRQCTVKSPTTQWSFRTACFFVLMQQTFYALCCLVSMPLIFHFRLFVSLFESFSSSSSLQYFIHIPLWISFGSIQRTFCSFAFCLFLICSFLLYVVFFRFWFWVQEMRIVHTITKIRFLRFIHLFIGRDTSHHHTEDEKKNKPNKFYRNYRFHFFAYMLIGFDVG